MNLASAPARCACAGIANGVVRTCLFTVELPEANIENALIRELLKPEDRANAWPAIQGCYAAQLSDAALRWLINGGVITEDQRGDAAAILRSISDWQRAAARAATRRRSSAASAIGNGRQQDETVRFLAYCNTVAFRLTSA